MDRKLDAAPNGDRAVHHAAAWESPSHVTPARREEVYEAPHFARMTGTRNANLRIEEMHVGIKVC